MSPSLYLTVTLWLGWADPASDVVVRVEPGVEVRPVTVAPLVLTWTPDEGFGASARVEVTKEGR